MNKQKLELSILINATKEKIWAVLLDDETYRKWTSVFCEGSFAVGSWDVGSKVHFKTPKGDGMVSRVLVHKPQEIITFEHYGILKNGIEDFESDEAKKWADSYETYKVVNDGSGTKLFIEMQVSDEYLEWFNTTWLKALDIVKELSEK